MGETKYPECEVQNWTDPDGNPSGGTVEGLGVSIRWQEGPLGRDEQGNTGEPNGAYVESILKACVVRLHFYQDAAGGKWQCDENAQAINHICKAIAVLEERMQAREDRGVRGTLTV